MAHPRTIVREPTLRRAIAAVCRGRLGEGERVTLLRLALEPRTALRLLVGMGVDRLDGAAVARALGALGGLGIEISGAELGRAFDAGLCSIERFGDRRTITRRAAEHFGADDACDLARADLSLEARGLLTLLGASTDALPRQDLDTSARRAGSHW